MTPEEVLAVRTALVTETNPSHLFGFASTLAPDHCTSASLVHARGTVLEQRRSFDAHTREQLLRAVLATGFASAPTPHARGRELLHARTMLDHIAQRFGSDPRQFHRSTRRAAGDLVVDEHAAFPDVPQPVVQLARCLVLTLGPVRVLDPAAVRAALPPSVSLATAEELEGRGRWVRHYVREARRYPR